MDAHEKALYRARHIANDVFEVAMNPLYLPNKAGGVGSLATAVELLAQAVAELCAPVTAEAD